MTDPVADLPILGESVVMDIANSWYVHPDGVVDFLGDRGSALRWLHGMRLPAELVLPRRWSKADVALLRGLRDAVRHLLDASVDGVDSDRRDVRLLNERAGAACHVVTLSWASGRSPEARRTVRGAPVPALLGHLAAETIAVLTASSPPRVRRCAHPTCSMLFIQDHHKRRFCHPGCSHRDRQQRYVQTRHQRPPVAAPRSTASDADRVQLTRTPGSGS